ncbi:hypothetical protein [uncultured Sphingobacterium sp.]|uniref:hypothetical protein n=1 Tax=uncultured Sphingobacterium sp. TaxID=182688 RepID=UPI0025CF3C85|nr:hypothetical protein [uncultured Sphingobacterium sp.]
MKNDEKKLVGTIAHFMVSDSDATALRSLLCSLTYQPSNIRTELIQLLNKWQNKAAGTVFPGEDLWPDFKQLVGSNPDLGVALIDGNKIDSIASFYEEINAVYMSHESWKIRSLDGFDDLLYGEFGTFKEATSHAIVWKDIDHSSASLGIETTLPYYQGKLGTQSPFNQTHFQKKIEELKAGQGETYFDIVAEIIRSHHKITWIYKGHPPHKSVYL